MADSEEIPLHPYMTREVSPYSADSEAQNSGLPSKDRSQIFHHLFKKQRFPDFEQSIREQVEDPEKSQIENAENSAAFAHAYRGFATKRLRDILESMIWYHRFSSSEQLHSAVSFPQNLLQQKDSKSAGGLFKWNRMDCKEKKTEKERKKATFGFLLQELSNTIASAERDCFELCVITAHVPSSHNAFSFSQKMRASIAGDLDEMYENPKLAALYMLKMHWEFDHTVLLDILKSKPIKQPITTKHVLPSKICPRNAVDTFRSSGYPEPRMTLQWYSRCSKYEGDLDTYVWQPYGQPPEPDYLKLYIATGESNSHHRAIIVFKILRLSDDFAKFLTSSLKEKPHLMMPKLQNPAFELAETVILLFRLVTEGSETFVQGLMGQLEKLQYEERKSPSGSKVQFLLHLNDCRIDALRCLRDCLLLLSDTGSSLTTYSALEDILRIKIQEELAVCEKDFLALIAALESAKFSIESIRLLIDQQLNLAQIRRQSVLAVLAALYLPLAYVSGIFGMNITSTSLGLDSIYTNITNLTNNATLDFTKLSPSQLDDILTVVGNSGGYAWDFKWYWITLVPLLLGSIILPILAGPIIRFFLQNIAKYRLYWRICGMIIVVFYIIGIYGFLWTYLVGFQWDRRGGFYPKEYDEGAIVAYLIYFILTAGVCLLMACYRLYCAFKLKTKRSIWFLFLIIVICCIVSRLLTHIRIEFGSYQGQTQDSLIASISTDEATTQYWISRGYSPAEAAQEANATATKIHNWETEKGPLVSVDILLLLPWILMWLGWAWPGIRRWAERKRMVMVKSD